LSKAATESATRTAHRFHVRPAYFLIAIVVVFFSVNFVRETLIVQGKQAKVNAVLAATQHERTYIHHLQSDVKTYSKPSHLRAGARALGYVPPGVVPVFVSVHTAKPSVHKSVAHVTHATTPAWHQWWNAFFGGN
jgi:hypothetical protein